MSQTANVEVPTPDGLCPSVVVTPDGEGPWPAVILFMDAFGVRPALVGMAEQLADTGYVVLVPELYYRFGPYEPFSTETAFTDPDERTRLMTMAMSVSPDLVASDAGAFLSFLSDRSDVAGSRVGTTGYCLGGRVSLVAAGHHPERIVAAASFHGGHLASDAPESPHHLVGRITGRVYVAAATEDPSFPPEQAELLEKTLTDAGVDHLIETYPAGHGFAVPDSPAFDADASARHWQALDGLYGAMLSN